MSSGVRDLAVPARREAWQEQHRASMLTDAQSYEAMADALEADARNRPAEGERRWQVARRAKRRARPLRRTAKAMRRAAREVSSTVAAYDDTTTEKAQARLDAKAERKATRKGRVTAQPAYLPPAEGSQEQAAPAVLGDYYDPARRQGA